MTAKKRKPRKNPLKGVVRDHRDKQAMRAHQRVAFKRSALVASASESTLPRDEDAVLSASPVFDPEWCPCQGLAAGCALCGG